VKNVPRLFSAGIKTTVWGSHPSPTKVTRKFKLDSKKLSRLRARINALEIENATLKKEVEVLQSNSTAGSMVAIRKLQND